MLGVQGAPAALYRYTSRRFQAQTHQNGPGSNRQAGRRAGGGLLGLAAAVQEDFSSLQSVFKAKGVRAVSLPLTFPHTTKVHLTWTYIAFHSGS